MDTAPQIVPPFAPEERYVYSSATHPIPALQRVLRTCALCLNHGLNISVRIRRGRRGDMIRRGRVILPFAPEERYVYSSATHPTRAPEERNVVLSHTIELVGVGCPNPLGGGTPPLRLPTYRSPAIRLALRPVSLHLCALCVK